MDVLLKYHYKGKDEGQKWLYTIAKAASKGHQSSPVYSGSRVAFERPKFSLLKGSNAVLQLASDSPQNISEVAAHRSLE